MELFPVLVALIFVVVCVFAVAAVLVGVWFARHVAHDLRMRRAVLLVQSQTAVAGPRRELGRLRLDILDAVGSAHAAIDTLGSHNSPVGDLGRLVVRVDRVARVLDAQLRLLRTEPDDATLVHELDHVRPRVEDVVRFSRSIRQAASASLGGVMMDEQMTLMADVEREVQALQSGMAALRPGDQEVAPASSLPAHRLHRDQYPEERR